MSVFRAKNAQKPDLHKIALFFLNKLQKLWLKNDLNNDHNICSLLTKLIMTVKPEF